MDVSTRCCCRSERTAQVCGDRGAEISADGVCLNSGRPQHGGELLTADVDHITSRGSRDRIQHTRYERPQVRNAIRRCMQDDDRYAAARHVLLKDEVAIHRDKYGEPGRAHELKQGTVAPTGPTFRDDVRRAELRHFSTKPPGNALVEKHPWSRAAHATAARAKSISLASSSTATACSRDTLGKSTRNSSSGSPASR